MREEREAVKLEEGKSYQLRTRNTQGIKKIHIDKVMKNPCYSARDEMIDNAEDLIVYRVWFKHKQSWYWYVQAYWEICMWNNWKYEK
tara:strand:- start:41216 stop:41476 length:261 start_codon:yes stop_codon:yes gene_type:complete